MKLVPVIAAALLLGACSQPEEHAAYSDPNLDPYMQLGLLWVNHAAEYEAQARQSYRDAMDDLPRLLADPNWSALPGQTDAADLPAAIILDYDETVISNVKFQLSYERPFDNWKLDEWDRAREAQPVPGALEFISAAEELGVTLFYVTNRPCEPREGIDNACPQKQTAIDGLREMGIESDADHVLFSQEQGWNREKSVRREYVGQTHRVIMLIGDDLTDFVACTRSSPHAPCTNVATEESRRSAVVEYDEYWGNGWYVLPNPMHGSWTSAIDR